jgi:hypothetical protein
MEFFCGGDLINRDAHSAFSFKKELIGEAPREKSNKYFDSIRVVPHTRNARRRAKKTFRITGVRRIQKDMRYRRSPCGTARKIAKINT